MYYKDGFKEQIDQATMTCDEVIKGLQKFLESKRDAFPRLYFLSNEELIEIYGKSSEGVQNMKLDGSGQNFLSRIFEGLDRIVLN